MSCDTRCHQLQLFSHRVSFRRLQRWRKLSFDLGAFNQVAQNAGHRLQSQRLQLPLALRSRWRSGQAPVQFKLQVSCWRLADCIVHATRSNLSGLAAPHPNTHFTDVEHLVIPELMTVRAWVVATCRNQSNLLCRLVIETAHMSLISPVAVCLRSTHRHPTSTQVFHVSRMWLRLSLESPVGKSILGARVSCETKHTMQNLGVCRHGNTR